MKNQIEINKQPRNSKQFKLQRPKLKEIQIQAQSYCLIQQEKIYICNKTIPDLQQNPVQHLAAIIFSRNQFDQIANYLQFDSQQIQLFKKHSLVFCKSKVSKIAKVHFIMISMPSEMIQKHTMAESTLAFIQKVVCLADQIVLISLNSTMESIFQKNYLQMLDYSYRFENTKRLSLCMVNRAHKKDSVSKEGIRYVQELDISCFNKASYFENYPLSADKILQLVNSQQSNKNAKMTHIKFTLEKYLKLQAIKAKVKQANQMLFESSQKKQVQRQINRMKLPKKIYDHLMWKSNQLSLYRNILQESNQNNFDEYKSITFKQVSIDTAISGTQVFGRKWMKNTFLELKGYFDTIASRRDVKTIKRFNEQCDLVENRLTYLIEKLANGQGAFEKQLNILQSFRNETRDFIKYHNEAIKGEFMSSWVYYKEEAKYLWRNDKTIYQRSLVLLLIVLMAAMQEDIILGLTVLSVGITFLAIRI